MEKLKERPIIERLDYDREQRLYDDTTTWLAEVLDGSMRTPFEYTFDGRELYGRDGGALRTIFEKSIQEAANLGSGLEFEHRRRLLEMDEYEDMIDMVRGDKPNTMVVVSDFPPELMDAQEDIGGYNVARKQTMLRVITKTDDGRLLMRSQSLDGSDRTALEDIYYSMGFAPAEGELLGQRMHVELDKHDQDFLADKLMGVYDRSLQARYGGDWYAGRSDSRRIDTYDFVCRQQDLLRAYMNASKGRLDEGLLINLAAAMKERLKVPGRPVINPAWPGIVGQTLAMEEMMAAGSRAAARGERFSGCGLSLSAGGEASVRSELADLGFGNKATEEKDDYGPLKFKCPNGHWNKRRPAKSPKDFLTHCKTCKASLKC